MHEMRNLKVRIQDIKVKIIVLQRIFAQDFRAISVKLISGPVHMEASQPAYRAGSLCRDLTSSLIPIQHLISVHMSRRAGPLSETSLV